MVQPQLPKHLNGPTADLQNLICDLGLYFTRNNGQNGPFAGCSFELGRQIIDFLTQELLSVFGVLAMEVAVASPIEPVHFLIGVFGDLLEFRLLFLFQLFVRHSLYGFRVEDL